MVIRLSAAVLALAMAPALAGCSGSDHPASKPSAGPTPIGKLDVASLHLVRAPFCKRVASAAVTAALGGKARSEDSWGNGDPLPGTSDSGSGDVGHEVGCSWTGTTGTTARAWVFARPVTTELAASLVGQAGSAQGCTAEPTPTFGKPALRQTCTLAGGVQRVRRAGLFGDTWLTCEVSGPAAPGLADRTDTWCAEVVAALDTA